MPPKMEWQTMQTLIRQFLLEESDLDQQCLHGHMSETLKNNIKPQRISTILEDIDQTMNLPLDYNS